MPKRKRTYWSQREQLLRKSREAALTAIKVFNDPLVEFKSETYIVLMVIAWTYLLHGYYRSKGIDYRYFDKKAKRRRFHRTKHGAFKYWELERCLNDSASPVGPDATNNLRFLIRLRHEIEHQMTRGLDGYLSGRYQACALNYNECLRQLGGARYAIDTQLTYSIQFLQLTEEQIGGPKPEADIPQRLKAFVAEFDGALTHEQYNSPKYSYRLVFAKKLVNRPGQADRVVEFIKPDSPLAKTIEKEYWVKKEVEKKKLRATHVAEEVQRAGFPRFRVQPEHVRMWQAEDAKKPGNGYGVEIEGQWFWYGSWVKRCIELCNAAGDRYR